MTTTHYPLTVWRGEYYSWTYTVGRVDDGEAENLDSAVAIEFQVKATVGGADPPLLAKAIGTGITVEPQTGTTIGQFTLELSPTDTMALAAGEYWYDLVVLMPGNQRHYVRKPNRLTVKGVVNPP